MKCGPALLLLSAVCATCPPGTGQSAPLQILTAPPPPLPPSPDAQDSAASAPLKTPYRITGTIVSASDLTPMAHVRVGIEADKPCSPPGPLRHQPVTGADGRFSIAVPCAGTWRLTARGPDLPTQRYEAHDEFSTGIVLTPAAATFEVTFPAAASASIFGFVTDEGGEPVRNAQVLLFESDLAEHAQADSSQATGTAGRRYSTVTTDDRGLYEFADVRPGTWVVAVDTRPWYATAVHRTIVTGGAPSQPLAPELDVTYPLTYVPGTPDPASAARIALDAGAREEADVRLTPVPSLHLRIRGPEAGTGNRRVNVPTLERLTPFGNVPFSTSLVGDTSDGTLEIAGLAPGTYLVGAPGRTRNPDAGDEAQSKVLTLGSDAPRMVDLSAAVARAAPPAAKAPATVSGVVSFQSKPDAGALILLVAVSAGSAAPLRAQANTDGSFLLAQVPPGHYMLVAIDHGWSSHYRDPAALAQYLAHGTPLNITAGAEAHQNLTALAP